MSRLVLIDGNSIMNRAFYGIMGSKMLMTEDGTYTNAVYGFLAILFKIYEDLNPEYMAVAFDLKAPTARHKMYEGYKANRHGMPDELAAQMPIIKEVLRNMNITIIEKEGYEADDVLGTLSIRGEKEGLDVTILSGDRDTFQLTSDKITVRIPRTKMGKTEVEDFDKTKIIETYGLEPKQLIEVKGLQGDTSDNIPGVPGVGEKTALSIIKEYGSIENLYKELEEGKAETIKGKTREKIIENKDLAMLSKELGTINREVPIEEKVDDLKVKEWDKEKVLEQFKKLRFNRYIERFNLRENTESKVNDKQEDNLFEIKEFEIGSEDSKQIIQKITSNKKMFYYLNKSDEQSTDARIKKQIKAISIQLDDMVYHSNIKDIEKFTLEFKDVLESEEIEKVG